MEFRINLLPDGQNIPQIYEYFEMSYIKSEADLNLSRNDFNIHKGLKSPKLKRT